MKILRVLVILSVLLITLDSYAANRITHFFKLYSNKTTVLDFKQTSINAMSGQKIERTGILTIKAKKSMIFDYKNERVIINDFEAVDYRDSKKYTYKLTGFNKVLFLLFLGKEDINSLFDIKKMQSGYELTPKYKSNINKVYTYFKDGQIEKLIIVDIYSNRTIYEFYAADCKRTQSGD